MLCNSSKDYGVTYYLTAEDERYPTLILQGGFGTTGYALDKNTGGLRRICICHAHSWSECGCGAWPYEDEIEEYDND